MKATLGYNGPTLDSLRHGDGKLPSYIDGGYPLVYRFADGADCCPGCANGENGSEAFIQDGGSTRDPSDRQWRIIGADVHYEGAPITCDHCNAEIASAYGDPENDAP